MTDRELRREVRDLFRFGFAATAEDVADALGIDIERAADLIHASGRPLSAVKPPPEPGVSDGGDSHPPARARQQPG